MAPYPVRTIILESGLLSLKTSTTSKPLPSPRRKSITAYAGGVAVQKARPATTVSNAVGANPRFSIARAKRRRNGSSSSSMSKELSDPILFSSLGVFVMNKSSWKTSSVKR